MAFYLPVIRVEKGVNMGLTKNFTVKIIAIITLLAIIHTPLWAEIIVLKSGVMYKGEIVSEDNDKIELKSTSGVFTIYKDKIKQIAKDVKELVKPVDELWEKAKARYEQALESKEDLTALHKELGKVENILYEAYLMYHRIREMFPDKKYAWLDGKKKEISEFMEEISSRRLKEGSRHREKPSFEENKKAKESHKEESSIEKPEEDTAKEEEWICPRCHGTCSVECDACYGTGQRIIECRYCKGTGTCKYCKGEKEIPCPRCKGKGYIIRRVLVPGEGGGMRTKRVDCPDCRRGRIKCPKCKGSGKCSKCYGTGIIKAGKCSKCQGTGKVKCPYCGGTGKIKGKDRESKGKIDNTKIITYKAILKRFDKFSNDMEEATDLQKERIIRNFFVEWNGNFAGKIIKWEGVLEQADKNEPWENTEVIDLTLISGDPSSNNPELILRLSPIWEEYLLKVSQGDTLVFLIIFPRWTLISSKDITSSNVEKVLFDTREWKQWVSVTLLGYKKQWEEKLREFPPLSK